jgi:glycosyltransferase involved in cell wall biosynthesis
MKIGFDISQTGQYKAGCGYYAHGLISHISQLDSDNQYFLYRTFGDSYWDPNYLEIEVKLGKNYQASLLQISREEASAFWKKPIVEIEKQLNYLDILHSNNFFCPSEGLQSGKLIYTVYDLSVISHPEWTTEENRLVCFNGIYQASLYANHIIAISEYTRQHFINTFPYYPANKISVIYPGSRYSVVSNASPVEKCFRLHSNQYWLNVATLEPRKNHRRLLKAYAQLKKLNKTTYPLVLVGAKGWLMGGLRDFITGLGIEKDVIFLDYVNEQQLCWLYQNCYCFVYPSLFEGFGMPVLEAMSLGAMVITANVSSIPEITGDAVLLVNPYKEEELFQAMLLVARQEVDLASFKQKGIYRSRFFCWLESAKKLLQLYLTLGKE